MNSARSSMLVRFKMDKDMPTAEWIERFRGSYDIIFNLPGILFKNWWINQQTKEWGAYYIFESKQQLTDYLNSELWTKKIPAKYGAKAEVTVLEPGPIICKEAFVSATK